jgi:hypothetical protein
VEQPNVVMIMRGRYDRQRAKGCLDLEWFVREDSRWRRWHEHFEEVWWTASEIRRDLHQAGFDRIKSWDGRRFSPRHQLQRGARTFYLARLAP